MTTIDGKPLKTIIHKLRPVKEIEPGYWKLRWRPIKHTGRFDGGDGTWNMYWSKAWSSHPAGLTTYFALPADGCQYGRSSNTMTIRLGLWWGTVEFWVAWGFRASTEEHGDGVDGIDLTEWGINKEPDHVK